MAYGDNTLGANHRWSFNNVLTDSIGSTTLTNTGGVFVAAPITRDATHAYQTNGRDDYATGVLPGDMGATAQEQYAFSFWFSVSQVQGPPTLIYKQGGTTAGFALFLWADNNVMLQVIENGNVIQLFSDGKLTDDREYNFIVKFSGTNFDGEVSLYINGTKQLLNKDGVAPSGTTMPAHSGAMFWGENGISSIDVPVGSESVLVKAPVNGSWAEFWSWSGNPAALTDTEIYEEVFAPGTTPRFVNTGTAFNIAVQIALQVNNTTRTGDNLVNQVEDPSDATDITISLDGAVYEDDVSVHFEWLGTGTLTIINTNGSNASKGVSPNGGTITFINPATLNIQGLIAGTEVRIFEAGTETELAGIESSGTSFSTSLQAGTVDIRILSLQYINVEIKALDMTQGDVTLNANQQVDRQFENA